MNTVPPEGTQTPPRWLVALAVGVAATLPPFLQCFGDNAVYFTFNVYRGILFPALTGTLLVCLGLFGLLLLERRWNLLRLWPIRLLVAVILVNLVLKILHGATDLEGVELLQKLGASGDEERLWRRIRSVFYITTIGLLAWLTWRKQIMTTMFRMFAAVVGCFVVLSAVRAAPAILTETLDSGTGQFDAAITPGRSVVWIIFDELDFNELEKAMEAGLAPAFRSLESSALKATRAYSPAARTLTSIPALLTAQHLAKVEIRNTELMVTPASASSPVRLAEVQNVFGSVQRVYGPVQVLAFYHPYCRLFGELAQCNSMAISNIPGVVNHVAGAIESLTLAGSDAAMSLAGVDPGHFRLEARNQWAWISKQQLHWIEQSFRPGSAALHFMHINVPHSPMNMYAEQLFGAPREPIGNADWYPVNLSLADRMLEQAMAKVKASGKEIMVIVSGDHGRRPSGWDKTEREGDDPIRHVPFIVWLSGAQASAVVDSRIDTRCTRAVIEGYLAGRINTLKEVSAMLDEASSPPSAGLVSVLR